MQTRNEETRRSRNCVGLRPIESFADSQCVIGGLTKEKICSSIDEERYALPLCRLTNGGNTTRLPIGRIETRPLDDAVLKIDADHAQVKET